MHNHENSEEKSFETPKEETPQLTNFSEAGQLLIVTLLSFASFIFYATVLPNAKPWVGISIFVLTTAISAMVLLRLSVGSIFKAILGSLPSVGPVDW